MAGYYVIASGVCPSVCPFIIFPIGNDYSFTEFFSNFAYILLSKMSGVGLLMGEIRYFFTELWSLSVLKNGFWSLFPFLC